MNINDIKNGFIKISTIMDQNKDYLVELDQQAGDGDLGISMSDGFKAIVNHFDEIETTNIGRLLNKLADYFNDAAPSSLGTIIAFIIKGMAKELKDKENECSLQDLAKAMRAGLNNVSEKAGSKVGQKTILDSVDPGVTVLENNYDDSDVWQKAAEAAKQGSEKTKQMKAVWGRAAYYGDASIGLIDGGSVVGALVFEALSK